MIRPKAGYLIWVRVSTVIGPYLCFSELNSNQEQILVQVPEELWRPRMNLIFGDGGSHPQKTVTPVQ